MNAFPPNDICGFLQLNAGTWLALRSLIGPDSDEAIATGALPPTLETEPSQRWHQADRGELTVAFLEPGREEDCGELNMTAPDGSSLRLSFHWDGSVAMNDRQGQWQLGQDGTLELELQEETRVVKERIWFSKPNLRLRCTLEQFLDGRPGRASFSSEIRRVQPPQEKR